MPGTPPAPTRQQLRKCARGPPETLNPPSDTSSETRRQTPNREECLQRRLSKRLPNHHHHEPGGCDSYATQVDDSHQKSGDPQPEGRSPHLQTKGRKTRTSGDAGRVARPCGDAFGGSFSCSSSRSRAVQPRWSSSRTRSSTTPAAVSTDAGYHYAPRRPPLREARHRASACLLTPPVALTGRCQAASTLS